MEEIVKKCLWKNFGAAIDMLKNSISLCPDELWQNNKRFFYLSYHTVIFLEYYLANPVTNFQPSLPYTLTDESQLPLEAVDDVIPDRFYSKDELVTSLLLLREKCKKLILFSSGEKLKERWINDNEINMHGLCPGIAERYSILEISFYNLRHVQHHVGQLNLILSQKANIAAGWVSEAD